MLARHMLLLVRSAVQFQISNTELDSAGTFEQTEARMQIPFEVNLGTWHQTLKLKT